MKLKKPGLRIIKTLIALNLALLISYFRPGESLPLSSAIAAIICLQQDVQETKEIGINRALGTIIGGICGLLYLLVVPPHFFPKAIELSIICIITSIIIWIMSMADKPKAIVITAIVFLSITVNHVDSVNLPYSYAFNTTFDTMIGVLIAFLINRRDFKHEKIEEKFKVTE